MSLSKEAARSGMHWWIANFTTAFKDIMETNPVLTQDGGQSTKERRLVSVEEKCSHIDYLEMKAVLFGLHSFCSNSIDKHIRIQSDNSTTEV